MSTPRNSSVVKAFDILSAFSNHGDTLSTAEVAKITDLTPATAHRFLLTLEELGVVARSGRGRFHLGIVLAELGANVRRYQLLIDVAQHHIDALTDITQEQVHLAVLEGGAARYIACGITSRQLRMEIHGTGGMPLHASAAGKVLLAGLEPSRQHALIRKSPLPKFTRNTVTNPQQLQAMLQEVQKNGYAVDNEELEDGLRCLAVPIRDGDGRVHAAISVSAPVTRLDDTCIGAHITELRLRAGLISRKLYVQSRVLTGKARPRGSYPHVKQVGDLVFISGTSARRPDNSFIGVRKDDSGRVHLNIAQQTRATIDNIRDILASVDCTLRDLAEIGAYLVRVEDYDGFNKVYAQFFDYSGPTRTTVVVKELPHPHQLLMMRAIAHKT